MLNEILVLEINPLSKIKFYNLERTVWCRMDKQYALAVILIILGVSLNQSGSPDSFYNGLSIGIIIMGVFWVGIRLIKEIKKK